jgi:hypothetical protein
MPHDYLQWQRLKDNANKNKPHTDSKLTRNEMAEISGQELETVFTMCQTCLRDEGDHFQHMCYVI